MTIFINQPIIRAERNNTDLREVVHSRPSLAAPDTQQRARLPATRSAGVTAIISWILTGALLALTA